VHMDKEKHVGSEAKSRALSALVAVLIVALLAAGTWTIAGVAGDGTAAPVITGAGQTGGKNSTPDNGDLPAAVPILAAFLGAVGARTSAPKRTVSRAPLSPRRMRPRVWV
jgi:hypothetical protein